MMKTYWNRLWLIGWGVILVAVLAYELTAFAFEVTGTWTFPTLSSLLIGLVPPLVLDALTIIVCALLLWHWRDLRKKLPP